MSYAQEHAASGHEEETFKIGEMIEHHVVDSHEWHFATVGHTHITLPLPVILYIPGQGVEVFSSSRFHSEGFKDEGEKQEHTYKGFYIDELDGHLKNTDASLKFYDLSITKNVASLFLSAAILIFVFTNIASAYKRRSGQAPKGMQSLFEPIVVFIRDDIAKANITGKDKHGQPMYEKFLPYLLTVFFFIWFNNLLGLLPGGANLTGNIAVTMFLAVATLVTTHIRSNKYYWGHIFAPPVPPALWVIMVPIEVIGILTKPISLMIRLFANITAGHIIILSLLGLIFIFKNALVGGVVVPFVLFLNGIELMVAILQAYVFTLLSSMYIGSAVEGHESHDDLGH
ncbi:F0F1 ATP synthase subunit A [Cytophagaceae bacterium DM2B3-1]|uniref:ATP synthase subunit a n=1 Tax=Xanthocytophaga flava TaxID=3048013 RepID=A0AAE3QXC6_9BACT|nr:F0F1 ATP synthase subunit A [Xanthocytophaga flavus]MDJ1468271.1 F0F1 ATP synthase subunit A [Xanthocytophaga flavus]MDJ1485285.1 F0F1 ATP synthase subunit A [Xanthocytophaga flavus]MDJ1494638.1 F0F1 ATP synthase subunit A [Xanthocytophaga flavus]